MLDNNIKVGNFYNNIGAGRKSGYEVAKKVLKELQLLAMQSTKRIKKTQS